MPDAEYASFLICNHKDAVNYYVNGLQIAVYDKLTGRLNIERQQDVQKFQLAMSASLAIINQLNPPK